MGPGRRPGEKEVRDVRPCDAEQQPRDSEEREEEWPDRTEDLLAERNEHRADVAVLVGVLARDALLDDAKLRLRLGQRDPRPQAPEHGQVVAAAIGLRIDRVRRMLGYAGPRREPELGSRRIAEGGRHDAHHLDRLAVERDGPPHRGRLAAESGAPQRLGKERGARTRKTGREGAADERRDPEEREEAGADDGSLDALGTVAAEQIETPRAHRRHAVEAHRLRLPGEEVRSRHGEPGAAAAQVRLPGIDQPLFLRKRQGAQEHGVHHFDDRERGAEAERENARGEQGEARTSNELSDRTGEEAHAARG